MLGGRLTIVSRGEENGARTVLGVLLSVDNKPSAYAHARTIRIPPAMAPGETFAAGEGAEEAGGAHLQVVCAAR